MSPRNKIALIEGSTRVGRRLSTGSENRKRSSSRRRVSTSVSRKRASQTGKPKTVEPKSTKTPEGGRSLSTASVVRQTSRTVGGGDVSQISGGTHFDSPRDATDPLIFESVSSSYYSPGHAKRRSSVTFDLDKNSVRVYKPSPRKFHVYDDEPNNMKLFAILLILALTYYAYYAVSHVCIR